jgi:hypothetical protein
MLQLDAQATLLSALVVLLAGAPAKGTVIIAFSSSNALYLASDSLAASMDHSYSNRVEKIRQVSKYCCFTLSGVATYGFPGPAGGPSLEFDCPQQMERAFRETQSRNRSAQASITNAVAVFETACRSFCRRAVAAGARDFDTALFTFWGYDDRQDCFFGLSWRSGGTNDGVFHASFDSRTKSGPLYIQGDSDFLSAFISNHNTFPTVELPDSSKKTWDKIVSSQPVSEEEIVSELVDLLAVHKKYSALFFPSSVNISEPYVIWRIRKDGTKRLGSFR